MGYLSYMFVEYEQEHFSKMFNAPGEFTELTEESRKLLYFDVSNSKKILSCEDMVKMFGNVETTKLIRTIKGKIVYNCIKLELPESDRNGHLY